MKKMVKKSKYSFTLQNINIDHINSKYGIKLSVKNTIKDNFSDNTTKLTTLNKNTPEVISFLDESKKKHNCYISIIDFESKMNINLLRYNCFWCRHPFNTLPIGCPINYIPTQVEKKYDSRISRNVYTIKQNITSKHREQIKNTENINLVMGEYYETDGVFCSFNCCQAWIIENKHNRLYDNSTMLLIKLYNTIMNTKILVISPAPHWRNLEQYGGYLNIISFRENFNKIDYEHHGMIRPIPKFYSVGTLFEEKIKF